MIILIVLRGQCGDTLGVQDNCTYVLWTRTACLLGLPKTSPIFHTVVVLRDPSKFIPRTPMSAPSRRVSPSPSSEGKPFMPLDQSTPPSNPCGLPAQLKPSTSRTTSLQERIPSITGDLRPHKSTSPFPQAVKYLQRPKNARSTSLT